MDLIYYTHNLKEKLIRRMKEIRTTSYALQFCTILIEAQKMHEECGEKKESLCISRQHCPKHSGQFLSDIKRILKHEPAEKIVEHIFEVLQAPKEESHVKEYFSNCLLKSESDVESTEYLNQLIETVESLVHLFFSQSLYNRYFPHRSVEEVSLGTLKKFMLAYGTETSTLFLEKMFWLGVSTLDFSLEEKKEVKDVLIEAMPYSETLIRASSSYFAFAPFTRTVAEALSLKKRSGLQFLRDLLNNYSAEHGIKEFIDNLDDMASAFDRSTPWNNLDSVNRYSSYSAKEISDMRKAYHEGEWYNEEVGEAVCDYCVGGRYVPKEHFWWENYKKANIYYFPERDSEVSVD